MHGFCSKCGGAFQDQMLCPQCGIQLAGDRTPVSVVALSVLTPLNGDDNPSIPRRLLLAGIVTFCLFQGLKHGASAVQLWSSLSGELSAQLVISLLAFAVFVGSILAGLSNRRAELSGFAVGLGTVGLVLGLEIVQGIPLPEEWLMGLPALFILLGVLGGFIGRLTIAPTPKLPVFASLDSRALPDFEQEPLRIFWFQIVLGAAIAIGGAIWAEPLRVRLGSALGGRSGGAMVLWQIATIVSLFGGLVAGATTRNGFRQGVIAGLFASIGTALAALRLGLATMPALEFWAETLGTTTVDVQTLVAFCASTGLSVTIGGWMGNQLFPNRHAAE